MSALALHCSGLALIINKIVSNNRYNTAMVYAWILLGVLASGIVFLIIMGIRSRNDGYIGMPPADNPEQSKADIVSHKIDYPSNINPSIEEQDLPYKSKIDERMNVARQSKNNDEVIDGTLEIESDYEEALIMLREVKAMLLQGRPDRAIEYIRQSSGVDHLEAEQFVRDIETGKLG